MLWNTDVIIEQTDEMYSIYVTATVVSTHIALQETDKAHLSGVPLKSLSFLTSQECEALSTAL